MKKNKNKESMEAKSDAAGGLRELFIDQLKDIYWAEKELTKALSKMKDNATSRELVEALDKHHAETEKQVERVEKIFTSIGTKQSAKKCEAMVGLIREGEEIMKETEKGMVRDAGIIAAAQKAEHYEIASYGTLSTFAQILHEDEAASLLNEILDEEKKTDKILTEIASGINTEAAEETENIKME